MCPSCLSGPIGAGYIAAFAVCVLFFVVALGILFWAKSSGRLKNLESTKYKVLQDD